MKKTINRDSLLQVEEFLKFFGKPYYIHAGLGLHLNGFDSELDDIDVKVFHEKLDDIFIIANKFFKGKAKLIEPQSGHFGVYMFPRVEIDLASPVDICTRTGAIKSDLGEVEFPFFKEIFDNVKWLNYKGIDLPVSSLESLFLYYLVLRRDVRDNKYDIQRITDILNSGKFNEDKFISLLKGHPKRQDIITLYYSYLKQVPTSS